MSRERVYYEDKRQYLEARGVMVTPKNSRPLRLRDSLREFEVSGGKHEDLYLFVLLFTFAI